MIDYGPACDANKVPNGADTRNIPRPQLGSIPYGGAGIYTCDDPGAIAITFDDGPYLYTSGLLDLFASYNFKATFFITGNNLGKGAIDDAATPWPAIVQRMITDGHQVASHTWSHQNLSAITQAQRINQMVRNEMAIRNIIQKFPTYMRPPYSACSTQCQADLAALGYVITYFDLDTDGMCLNMCRYSGILTTRRLQQPNPGQDPGGQGQLQEQGESQQPRCGRLSRNRPRHHSADLPELDGLHARPHGLEGLPRRHRWRVLGRPTGELVPCFLWHRRDFGVFTSFVDASFFVGRANC